MVVGKLTKANNIMEQDFYNLQQKIAVYDDSGRVGTSNTVNRAELIGTASALRAKCSHIAADSACFLNNMRSTCMSDF